MHRNKLTSRFDHLLARASSRRWYVEPKRSGGL
jgi:hypothetical protein